MAGTQVDMSDRIIAVRLVNTSTARFCHPGADVSTVGDWVVLPTVAGDEAGRIVVDTDVIDLDGLGGPFPTIRRHLSDDEIDRTATLQRQAIELTAPIAGILRESGHETHLTGLRHMFSGDTLVVSYRGDDPAADAELISALQAMTGLEVITEREPGVNASAEHLFGGVGRVARDMDLRTLLEQRVRTDGPFPGGLPRLGSQVLTPNGQGLVRKVSTRDETADVELGDGHRVTVPVASLAPVR